MPTRNHRVSWVILAARPLRHTTSDEKFHHERADHGAPIMGRSDAYFAAGVKLARKLRASGSLHTTRLEAANTSYMTAFLSVGTVLASQ